MLAQGCKDVQSDFLPTGHFYGFRVEVARNGSSFLNILQSSQTCLGYSDGRARGRGRGSNFQHRSGKFPNKVTRKNIAHPMSRGYREVSKELGQIKHVVGD